MALIRSIKQKNIVLGYIGLFGIIVSLILLLPFVSLFFYPSDYTQWHYFVIPSGMCFIIGSAMVKAFGINEHQNLTIAEDSVIVVSVWVLATFFSALPFVLSGQMNFTQAYFEAVSGWTTTGLSVADVEHCPKIFLMHRSVMQFFGGVGLVLVMVSALSASLGLKLYSSEGHPDRLLPNLLRSSRMIMSIYSGYVIMGSVLYRVFGMTWFEAINHSIAALSTGGFGTRAANIGAFKSYPIEVISIILMLLGTTNFAAHLLLVKRKFRDFFKVGEVRFMFLLLGLSIPLVAFFSLYPLYGNLSKSLRVASFELVSALTTTGFSTVSYLNWNGFAILVMILLMIVGGGAGSTAGGVKLYRVYVMFKNFWWNLKRQFLPEHRVIQNAIIKPEGKTIINQNDILDMKNYAFIYMILLFLGTGILTLNGYPLDKSLFEFASALGTVGVSIGVTAPDAPKIVLWAESIGMLFGRLEIFVFFTVFLKFFKRLSSIKKH